MEPFLANASNPTTSQNSNTYRPITSVSTSELYDRWASVYDSDGNILQAIDDQELPPLLTQLLAISASIPPTKNVKITELGCGTGRNTLKLLRRPFGPQINSLTCLDLSEKMIDVARSATSLASPDSTSTLKPVFQVFDALQDAIPTEAAGKDAVISTLVLEHLPLDVFFSTARKLLKPGGALLLTNMHSEMGKRSQAGFVNQETGEKFQGTSFAHTIEETVAAAEKTGFRIVGEIKERRVEEHDLDTIGGRGRKWVGCKVWFGCVFRLHDI